MMPSPTSTLINLFAKMPKELRSPWTYIFLLIDNDECANANPCSDQEKCVNTLGSYRCGCDEGRRLIMNSRTQCEGTHKLIIHIQKMQRHLRKDICVVSHRYK